MRENLTHAFGCWYSHRHQSRCVSAHAQQLGQIHTPSAIVNYRLIIPILLGLRFLCILLCNLGTHGLCSWETLCAKSLEFASAHTRTKGIKANMFLQTNGIDNYYFFANSVDMGMSFDCLNRIPCLFSTRSRPRCNWLLHNCAWPRAADCKSNPMVIGYFGD